MFRLVNEKCSIAFHDYDIFEKKGEMCLSRFK